ncbi:hypothetical protein pb186bvf_002322 [Paramecium bursaria]
MEYEIMILCNTLGIAIIAMIAMMLRNIDYIFKVLFYYAIQQIYICLALLI